MTYCQHVVHVGTTTCLLSVFGDMWFDRLGRHFFPNVGPTFLMCCRHVVTCQDDMSFGGSQQHDVTPTIPTKVIRASRIWKPESKTIYCSPPKQDLSFTCLRHLHQFFLRFVSGCILDMSKTCPGHRIFFHVKTRTHDIIIWTLRIMHFMYLHGTL